MGKHSWCFHGGSPAIMTLLNDDNLLHDKILSNDDFTDFIAIIFTAKGAGKLSKFLAMIWLKA